MFDIQAGRSEGLTGVWVGDYKVAAIGVKIRRWVTVHGVSINVDPDMRYFANIVPCGITDPSKSVGSICQLNGQVSITDVSAELSRCFAKVFDVEIEEMDMESDASDAFAGV